MKRTLQTIAILIAFVVLGGCAMNRIVVLPERFATTREALAPSLADTASVPYGAQMTEVFNADRGRVFRALSQVIPKDLRIEERNEREGYFLASHRMSTTNWVKWYHYAFQVQPADGGKTRVQAFVRTQEQCGPLLGTPDAKAWCEKRSSLSWSTDDNRIKRQVRGVFTHLLERLYAQGGLDR